MTVQVEQGRGRLSVGASVVKGTLLISMLLAASAAPAATLFKYQGKAYGDADLTVTQRQQLFDIEQDRYQRMTALAEQVLVDQHIAAEAKRSGKTAEQVEAGLFAAPEPSEKEISAWYEANKSRVPSQYKLEQITGEIKTLLKNEAAKKKRDDLVAELSKKGKLELSTTAPVSPVLQIDTKGYPVKGPAKAAVQIVEFADYQCPHCFEANEALKKVLPKFEGKVNFVYMDYPINHSGISLVVAHGAVCADEQGKFWPYHDLAFEKQRTLSKDSPAALAKELGLDEKAFATCLAGDAAKQKVAKAQAQGQSLGISGTPTLYLNGKRTTAHDEAGLTTAIEAALKGS